MSNEKNSTKCTPGEWRQAHDVIIDKQGNPIARMVGGRWASEHQANAGIMAASLQLLIAANNSLQLLEAIEWTPRSESEIEWYANTIQSLAVAIKKAEGVSPNENRPKE